MPLCKHYINRYHLNMLIIIYIIYHIYIGSELYNLVYGKIKVGSIKWNFKNKQWVSGNIMIISQEMLYSEVHVDM